MSGTRNQRRRQNGFTLIELLVVVAIIGILMTLGITGVQKLMRAGRKSACINNLKQLYGAASNFTQDNGGHLPYSASEYYFHLGLDDGAQTTALGTHHGWVAWYDEDNEDYRSYCWGDKGIDCIRKGTLFNYLGDKGDESVYACPEHIKLARKVGMVDCSSKSLAGSAGGSGAKGKVIRQAITRSYAMNDRLSHSNLATYRGASRTMLFAELAFESQHDEPKGNFTQGAGLRYVSDANDATDEWNDPPLEEIEEPGWHRQRFYRSWDGALELGSSGELNESIGEYHSRNYKRPDGSIAQQGVAVFLDGHIETVDIQDTYKIATGNWGDD
jgi:prepilin-type N-terminal cleavage/methylation domain-containing protein